MICQCECGCRTQLTRRQAWVQSWCPGCLLSGPIVSLQVTKGRFRPQHRPASWGRVVPKAF